MERERIRPVYVYTKTLTTMDKLKPGDFFSMDPESEADSDFVFSGELFIVSKDGGPVPQIGKPEGFFEVKGQRLIVDENFRRN